MGRLIEELSLRNKLHIFKDRAEAGRLLAFKLTNYASSETLVLAIPAGGVPVALEAAKSLHLLMDIIIVRKIQIPGTTEAGFGAVGPDGEVIYNETLLGSLRLTGEEIEEQTEKAKGVLKARNKLYRMDRPFPDLKDKTVILIDDGIASGYSMSEAMRFVKRKKVKKVIVAAPTAPEGTANFLLPAVDELYCLNVRELYPFAVADAYKEWYDLSDEEVISLLKDLWNA